MGQLLVIISLDPRFYFNKRLRSLHASFHFRASESVRPWISFCWLWWWITVFYSSFPCELTLFILFYFLIDCCVSICFALRWKALLAPDSSAKQFISSFCESERWGERETHTHTHTETERQTDRQRETETERDTHTETERERETHTHTHTHTQRQRQRDRDRNRETEKDRDTETEKDRQTDRDREILSMHRVRKMVVIKDSTGDEERQG